MSSDYVPPEVERYRCTRIPTGALALAHGSHGPRTPRSHPGRPRPLDHWIADQVRAGVSWAQLERANPILNRDAIAAALRRVIEAEPVS
jgi:hypothetical protein